MKWVWQLVFVTRIHRRSRAGQVYVMDADGGNRWQVSDPLPNRVMSFEGWSPDGTQILYTGFLGGLVKDSIVIIATLDPVQIRSLSSTGPLSMQ